MIDPTQMPKPLSEAVAAISAKTPIGSELRSADWEKVPLALRHRAQFSAGVTSAKFLQEVQNRIQSQITQQREWMHGKEAIFDRSSFIDSLREIARSEGLAPSDPKLKGGLQDVTSIPRLGLIYDMQNQMAAGYARHKLDNSEGALLLYPAYELGPSSAREPRDESWWQRRWIDAGGQLREGRMVALKSDPIWARLSRFGTPWPPFDWGSTRGLEEVDRDEAVRLGLIAENERLPSGEQDFNDSLAASVKDLSPRLQRGLQTIFGDQIQITAGEARWNDNPVGTRSTASPSSPLPKVVDAVESVPTTAPADNRREIDLAIMRRREASAQAHLDSARNEVERIVRRGVLAKIQRQIRALES
jgi:hypothetical protein